MSQYDFTYSDSIAAHFNVLFTDKLFLLPGLHKAVLDEFSRPHGYFREETHPQLHDILFAQTAEALDEAQDEIANDFESESDSGIYTFTQTAVGILGVVTTHLKAPITLEEHYTLLANQWFKLSKLIEPLYDAREDAIDKHEKAKRKAPTDSVRERLQTEFAMRVKTDLLQYRSDVKLHVGMFEKLLKQVEEDFQEYSDQMRVNDPEAFDYGKSLTDSLKDILAQIKRDTFLDGHDASGRVRGR